MPLNPNCPACQEKRVHTDAEWTLHPGEGRSGQGEDIPIKTTEPAKDKPEAKR